MTGLAWTLARSGGWPRMVLVAGCTAVVSALLLVVVALLRLPRRPAEVLFEVVADPGTRAGAAFAAVLLVLPPLFLLHQAVRLGTAARERRLAALRLAGATPRQVRGLGAFEVGLPALVGSVLGLGVYGVLRALLGGSAAAPGERGSSPAELVPTSVAPLWWQVLLVLVGVAAAGLVVGLRASGGVVVSPLGVTRRVAAAPPRPWGLLVLASAAASVPVLIAADVSEAWVFAPLGLVVIGVMGLASWVAYRVGRATEVRARSATLLLAARRVVAEPRPVGRAAAAIGGIALVAGGAGAFVAALVEDGVRDRYYWSSLLLVAIGLVAALLVATGSLAVHSVESLLDRKRSVAALAAAGTPLAELERAQRWEAMLVALPMATAGVLLGAVPLGGLFTAFTPTTTLVMLGSVVATLALVWLAIVLAVRATRPWMLRAAAPGNLRTE